MLKINSAKVTASPNASGWVQVHVFNAENPEKNISRGDLYIVVASSETGEGIEAITFEREIVGKLKEFYYDLSQGKAFDALRASTQRVVDDYSLSGRKIEIACTAFVDNIVYSSAFGGSKVKIIRDGSLASILESGNEIITASGFPKDGDLIILGTEAFFNKVNSEELKKSLGDKNPDSAVEVLTPFIYGGVEVGTAGATILRFGDSSTSINEIASNPGVPSQAIEPGVVPTVTVDLKAKFVSFIKGFMEKIPKRSVYVRVGMQDEAVSQSRKLTLSVGIILLAILAVSIGFGVVQKNKNNSKKVYQALLMSASEEVTQAINLASTDPEGSRQLFLSSEGKLAEIKSLKIKDQKITELENRINESRVAVLGEYVVNPELFLDLGLLSSGFKGDKISFSGSDIYILDRNGSRIVSVAMDTKKSKVVAGPTVLDTPLDIASYDGETYVLLQDGVYLVGNTKTKVIEKTWGGEALIHSFAGNLYVLDKSGNAIYRYAGESGNTFGSQQSWLSASTKADFSGSLSWGMNGAIYVLYPNSKILKYSLGSPQNFSISGVSPEIGNIDAINADPDNQYVYLLDKMGKRVVVIDKNGKYKAQYISDQVSSASTLVASEAEKKIILLTGDKLLSIELKGI